jgi:hypothetical protein
METLPIVAIVGIVTGFASGWLLAAIVYSDRSTSDLADALEVRDRLRVLPDHEYDERFGEY